MLLDDLLKNFQKEAQKISSLHKLLELKSKFLGKKSFIASEFKRILTLDTNSKSIEGQKINNVKNEIEKLFDIYKSNLEKNIQKSSTKVSNQDLTIPFKNFNIGKIHPLSQAQELLYDILVQHGFEIKSGPEVENDWYNFTALNIQPDHPARKMHDTFYLKGPDQKLLRTHTSNVQIRSMEKANPPFKFVSLGKTFRSDSDKTHTPMFHQMEGLLVNKDINFSHLKFLMRDLVEKFFNNKNMEIRFRPSYFPFTEPSCEVDIRTSHTEPWLEILGCGMVNPKVLSNVNVDYKVYQGFAFGLGLERITMIKNKINDLREFFTGDLKWVKHFGISPFNLNKIFLEAM